MQRNKKLYSLTVPVTRTNYLLIVSREATALRGLSGGAEPLEPLCRGTMVDCLGFVPGYRSWCRYNPSVSDNGHPTDLHTTALMGYSAE